MVPYVITAIITFVITAVAIWFISAEYHKRVANTKIGNAEEKARGIIDEAVKTAENKKRESMLESVVLCRRKKIWTRRWKRWRSVKQALMPKKKS